MRDAFKRDSRYRAVFADFQGAEQGIILAKGDIGPAAIQDRRDIDGDCFASRPRNPHPPPVQWQDLDDPRERFPDLDDVIGHWWFYSASIFARSIRPIIAKK